MLSGAHALLLVLEVVVNQLFLWREIFINSPKIVPLTPLLVVGDAFSFMGC